MLFQRIDKGQAERVFSYFYNVSGGTITQGYAAQWDTGTTDGVRVTTPTTAGLSLFVGIAVADVANSAYGKFQVYGYRASAYVINSYTTDVTAGDILVPVNGQGYLAKSAVGDGKSGFAYFADSAFGSVTQTTLAAAVNGKKIFLRCL